MNRKEYKRTGVVLVIVAVLQYIVLGCVVSTVTDIAWIENVSLILLVVLLSGGMGMMLNVRNPNSYKKVLIEEKDERNKQIKLSSCGVTLFISFIGYIGVFIYMKNTGIISGIQTAIFCIPVFVGTLAYGLSTLYFRRRI